jgi:sialic acid synthase SpsE
MLTQLPTTNIICSWQINVNQSLYRPKEALKVPGSWGSQISKQSAQESGMVVIATSTSHLELFLVLIYVKG